jgi:hypothetical protein
MRKFRGEDRENCLAALSNTMHRNGCARDKILEQVALENRSNCDPPLPHDDLPRLVDAAFFMAAVCPPSAGAWESPVPFDRFEVQLFPVEVFAGWLESFVVSEAVATQTPVDLAAMLVLAVLAMACAIKFRVRLKPGHEEPVNLNTVTVMDPGTRKSPVLHDVTAPVEAYEADESERLKPEIQHGQQRHRILQARLKHAEERAAKADGAKRARAIEEAKQAREELESLAVPVTPRLIVDDCSPEKLASLLHQHGGAMAQLSAEGGVFDILAGRYSSHGMPNLDVYLKGHAGDPLRVDRVGRESEHIPSPALTMGLAVQPARIQGMMNHPEFRGYGLLARFLYAVPPSLLGHRDVDAPPMPDGIRAAYEQGIVRILRISRATNASGGPAPFILTLDEEARDVFRQFERDIEPRLGEYGDLAQIADWAAKLAGAVGRIAGLFHVSDCAGYSDHWDEPITADCLRRAVRVGHYLIPHALAAFGSMGADPAIAHARYLLGWLERTGVKSFTKRQAFEGTKGRFQKVGFLEPPLALLEEHRYIRLRQVPARSGAGRPASPTYEVNPALASQYSHYSRNGYAAPDGAEGARDAR